jgi:hypothetical protein
MFTYWLAIGAFPLMYIGGHYATDIIAGCAIGALIGSVLNTQAISERLSAVFRLEQWSQSAFMILFFLVTYQIASMFGSVRWVGVALVHLAARQLHPRDWLGPQSSCSWRMCLDALDAPRP